MDRAVVEALADRGLYQPVLVDPAKPLELGRRDGSAQVIALPGLVDHLDLGAGQGPLDH